MQQALAASLTVIGAGVIGLEFVSFYATLGVNGSFTLAFSITSTWASYAAVQNILLLPALSWPKLRFRSPQRLGLRSMPQSEQG